MGELRPKITVRLTPLAEKLLGEFLARLIAEHKASGAIGREPNQTDVVNWCLIEMLKEKKNT